MNAQQAPFALRTDTRSGFIIDVVDGLSRFDALGDISPCIVDLQEKTSGIPGPSGQSTMPNIGDEQRHISGLG